MTTADVVTGLPSPEVRTCARCCDKLRGVAYLVGAVPVWVEPDGFSSAASIADIIGACVVCSACVAHLVPLGWASAATGDYRNSGALDVIRKDGRPGLGRSAATAGGDVSTGAVTPVGPAEAAKEQA